MSYYACSTNVWWIYNMVSTWDVKIDDHWSETFILC